jgi:hypothetical protein
MMPVDRCDFQVPPARPGWYGIMSSDAAGNILHQGRLLERGRTWPNIRSVLPPDR